MDRGSGELDSESDYGDSEASSEYSATVEGNDVITVTSGSESIEIPVTVSGSTPSEIVITDDNYADYFDLANNGTIKADCGIVDGTTVYIANVTNKVFTFDKSVNVVGVEGSKISNGYVHLVGGASGSNITGLTIINDVTNISTGAGNVYLHGIWLTSVENCTISDNFVQTSVNRSVFAMPLTNASYNVIANNSIIGGASTCMPMGASSHNIIADNYLSTVGANIIYYNPYGHADYSSAKYPGSNNYNVISNNVLNLKQFLNLCMNLFYVLEPLYHLENKNSPEKIYFRIYYYEFFVKRASLHHLFLETLPNSDNL